LTSPAEWVSRVAIALNVNLQYHIGGAPWLIKAATAIQGGPPGMARSTTTTAADHISGLFIINMVVVVVHRGRFARTTTTRAHTTSDATNVHWTGAIQSRARRGIEVRNAVTEIMKDAADQSALRLSCGCPCAATSVRGKSENIWKTWKVLRK